MRIQSLLLATLVAMPSAAHASARTLDEIRWETTLPAAQREAQRRECPILIYFWLDGSSFCEQMYSDTLTTREGVAELAQYVCLTAPADHASARELVQRFGVATLPTLVFVDAEGAAQDAIEGFMALPQFLQESQRIRSDQGTVADWRRQVEAAPDDLDVRLRLALQLEHVGQVEESEALIASIKRDDPDGETHAGAQLQLYDVFDIVRSGASDPSDPRTYELSALYAHMPKVKPETVLFEGWKWIADIEGQRGDRPKERAAWTLVWEYAPDGPTKLNNGFTIVQRFFQMEVELSARERRLAREISDHMQDAAAAAAAAAGVDAVNFDYIHHTEAMALAIEGKRVEALAMAEKAVAADPDDPAHQRLRDLLQSREP